MHNKRKENYYTNKLLNLDEIYLLNGIKNFKKNVFMCLCTYNTHVCDYDERKSINAYARKMDEKIKI